VATPPKTCVLGGVSELNAGGFRGLGFLAGDVGIPGHRAGDTWDTLCC